MYKTILCAIESTKEGESVLSKASELAKLCNGKLLVIHVLPYKFLPKDYQKELKEDALPKIEIIADKFGVHKENRIVMVGKPHEVICSIAEKNKADLIVIGTHSRTGIKSLLGSTANNVVNYAECDVSLVKI
jgi:universal stress protein A